MADYYLRVEGNYTTDIEWGFGRHVTSAQSPSALLTTWTNAWVSAWTDGTHGLQTLYPTTTTMSRFSVATLDGLYLQTAKVQGTSSHAGTGTDDSLPFAMATLVALRSTTQIGKHARGHFYLPAMIETVVNADVLTPTAGARASLAVNAVRTAVQADGSTFFVVDVGNHRAVPPVLPGPKYVMDAAWTVSDKPATQRSRVKKVKPTRY